MPYLQYICRVVRSTIYITTENFHGGRFLLRTYVTVSDLKCSYIQTVLFISGSSQNI